MPKISELTEISSPDSTDYLVVVHNGKTTKVSVDNLVDTPSGLKDVLAEALQATADEETRAKSAESTLGTQITVETSRAKAAETANANAITAEQTRAKAAEKANAGSITDLNAALSALGLSVVDGKLCATYTK